MTLPLGSNYGGIMQAFALQKILKDIGHEVITVDYDSPPPNLLYRKARTSYRICRKLIGKYTKPINLEDNIEYILENNLNFINNNISISKKIYSTDTLKKHFKQAKYDVVIVGSDQTWRPKYSPNIYNFYLEFLKKNKDIIKIAYASSFGVDKWEYSKKETRKCAKLAKRFDLVSVREQSGVDLCNKFLGIHSVVTLDPTLLLDKEDYIDLMGNKFKKNKNEGLLTYFLDKNVDKTESAKLIAKNLNTYVYNCQSRNNGSHLSDYKMPHISDWLASFANAQFVLTDSFHGMIFSIIFDKPFLVIVNEERGASRFESFLNQIGGEDHLIYNCNHISKNISSISAIKPLSKDTIQLKRDFSIKFLKNSINKKI